MITDLTLVSFVFHVRSRHTCFFQSMCRIWVSIRVPDLMKGFDVQIFMCDLRRKAASRLRRESGLLWFFVCLVALVLRSEYVTGTDVARCAKHHKNTSRPHNGKKTTDMDSFTTSSSRLRSRGGNRRARSYRFGWQTWLHSDCSLRVCSLQTNGDREKGRVSSASIVSCTRNVRS